MSLTVVPFYHSPSHTLSYVLFCPTTRHAALIDAVADYDAATDTLSFASADIIIRYLERHQLTLKWLIETHVHADHFSACNYVGEQCGGQTVVSQHIRDVQKTLKPIYQLACATNGEQFDKQVNDGDHLPLGDFELKVLATPGHTPDGISIYVDGHVFIGDTLFMPDSGSARCDFPKGSAEQLYHSIQKLLSLPSDTKVWVCHDYQPEGRALDYHSTIGCQREQNVHLQQSAPQFIAQRQQRDATLNKPKLMDKAVPFNLQGARVGAAGSPQRL